MKFFSAFGSMTGWTRNEAKATPPTPSTTTTTAKLPRPSSEWVEALDSVELRKTANLLSDVFAAMGSLHGVVERLRTAVEDQDPEDHGDAAADLRAVGATPALLPKTPQGWSHLIESFQKTQEDLHGLMCEINAGVNRTPLVRREAAGKDAGGGRGGSQWGRHAFVLAGREQHVAGVVIFEAAAELPIWQLPGGFLRLL